MLKLKKNFELFKSEFNRIICLDHFLNIYGK